MCCQVFWPHEKPSSASQFIVTHCCCASIVPLHVCSLHVLPFACPQLAQRMGGKCSKTDCFWARPQRGERVCIAVLLPHHCLREARRLATQLYAWCSIVRCSTVPVNHSRVFKSALGAGYCDTRGLCLASLPTHLHRVFASTDCKSWTPEAAHVLLLPPEGLTGTSQPGFHRLLPSLPLTNILI